MFYSGGIREVVDGLWAAEPCGFCSLCAVYYWPIEKHCHKGGRRSGQQTLHKIDRAASIPDLTSCVHLIYLWVGLQDFMPLEGAKGHPRRPVTHTTVSLVDGPLSKLPDVLTYIYADRRVLHMPSFLIYMLVPWSSFPPKLK